MVVQSKEKSSELEGLGTFNKQRMVINLIRKAAVVGAVYLCGYFNLSLAWLVGPVILLVFADEWKKYKDVKRNVAKALANCSEKEVILSKFAEVPSWVFFPDVERVEWLNKIIRRIWPHVNHYAKDILKNSIEPSVRDSLSQYKMNGFAFEKMVLGSIPLKVGGVKVYDHNVPREEIILDMDIFYAGDCDISFSIGGIKGGIKDLQIKGNVRVVMKPLISQMPLVGGLQVFFLQKPSIDFNLVGVADLLDMPGLSDMLRRITVETVANIMVLPNKIPITLSDSVSVLSLKMPDPEGVVRIHVVEAKDLMKKDITMLGMGKSDPYCLVTVGDKTFRTKTIDNSLNPKWDFWCEFAIEETKFQFVLYELFDKDRNQDDFLGRATVELNQVTKKKKLDLWLTLEGAKRGMVYVRMTWLALSKNRNDLKAALEETQLLRVTSMSTAVLIVYIDSACELPKARTTSLPDPFAVMSVGKNQQQTTNLFRTVDPVWEQGFTFLIHNPESDTLTVKVVDSKTSQDLGIFVYNLSSLLQKDSMEIEKQPFNLSKSGPNSKINLAMHLRILKYEEPDAIINDIEIEKKDEASQPLLKPEPPVSSLPSPQQRVAPDEANATNGFGTKAPLEHSDSIKSAMEDLIVPVLAPPGVDAAPGLRHRTSASNVNTGALGRVRLTLRYSVTRQRLVIVVHKVENLPLLDPNNIPDPYVKLYLLPERSKESKRKTDSRKDDCNPVFDQTFEYVMSYAEARTRQLEVSVITRKGFLQQSPVMGQVILDLSTLNLTEATTLCLDLQPENSRNA